MPTCLRVMSVCTNALSATATATATATPEHLLSFLMRHLHTSSNLHEELHHSFFLYFLMGHRHFIGLPEYASCLLLLTLPLLLLFLVMYDLSSKRSIRGWTDSAEEMYSTTAVMSEPHTTKEGPAAEVAGEKDKDTKEEEGANPATVTLTHTGAISSESMPHLDPDSSHPPPSPPPSSLHCAAVEVEPARLMLLSPLHGAWHMLLLDVLSGLLVCGMGYCFLSEYLYQSPSQRSDSGTNTDTDTDTDTSSSRTVAAVVVTLYDVYQHLAPAVLQIQGPPGGIGEVWYCFTSMCCAAYGISVLVYHLPYVRRPPVANLSMASKKQSQKELCFNNDGVDDDIKTESGAMEEGVVVKCADDDEIWLRGYVVSYLLVLSCLVSVLAMHHSAMAFFLVIPLVPVVFTHVVMCFYFFSSNTCADVNPNTDPDIKSRRRRRSDLCGWIQSGTCVVMSVCVSPPVVLAVVTLLRGAADLDPTGAAGADYSVPAGAAGAAGAAGGSCENYHSVFYGHLFRLLFSFVEEVSV